MKTTRTRSRTVRLAIASALTAFALGAAAQVTVIATGWEQSPTTAHSAMVPHNNPWPGPTP
jgi:hypothetical protein